MNPAVLRAQIEALEVMYYQERRCENARRILNLIHEKKDLLAMITKPKKVHGPVQKTEDKHFCNHCLFVGYADYIEATGSITCAECDSADVIPLAQKQREDRQKREAFFADMDREADMRARA